ncbi:dirigent protein 21-like [Andrographis paniculata]|uniref:dirigent protein 21-like n=1 Tax=Andrographis paniculata TaxID=175694 RepID=UPI0021E9072C|nr:dirigent protein 21-like [Andrographis paniculata]
MDSLVKAMMDTVVGDNLDDNRRRHRETEEEENLMKLLKSKEKVAKLHFYLHDALGGGDGTATVWEVARASITATSATGFGQVRVVDSLITVTPDINSEKLGKAQGMITFTGLDDPALSMNLNFHITAGEFSGSSLCVVGRIPASSTNRELPVVGGTGVFRMARGYTISNTYSFDITKNYGVLEYTAYVAYPNNARD